MGRRLRFIWNASLAWANEQRTTTGKWPRKAEIQRFIVGLKAIDATAWVREIPAHALLALATDIDRAFLNWFEKRSRRPRFRGKFGRAFSVYMGNQATVFDGGAVRLPKLGRVKFRGGDIPAGRLLSSRVSCEAGKWFLSAVFECGASEATVAPVERVGIDMGVARPATVFDGASFRHFDAPRALRKHAARLRRYQRAVSRRRKGSKRCQNAKNRVARLHQRIANIRRNFAHKATTAIVASAQTIKVETLNVGGMLKNGNLAKSVSDAGISQFVTMLRYKTAWHSRTLVEADQWFASSRTCSACGTVHEMPLSRRWMSCACGNEMDRDENAAVNRFGYGEERRNLSQVGDETRGEPGEQAHGAIRVPVPVVEPRILKRSGAHLRAA